MKKVKLIAIIVLILSVVGLGVLGARKLLQILEERSSKSSRGTSAPVVTVAPSESPVTTPVDGVLGEAGQAPAMAGAASDTGSSGTYTGAPGAGLGGETEMASASAQAVTADWQAGTPGEKWVAYAAQKGVNVRAGPDTSEKMLFVVGKGTKGLVTARQNGWSELKWDFNRQTGWVRDDLLLIGPDEVMQQFVRPDGTVIGTCTPELITEATIKMRAAHRAEPVSQPLTFTPAVAAGQPAPAAPSVTLASGEKWVAYAAQKGVNVRAGPATSDKLLFLVGKGTKGTVTARAGGWSQIKWDFNRKSGWVRDDLLLIGPEEVMRNFVAPDGTMIASFTPEAMKKVTKKAHEIAQNISVGVARPAPPSETVKGFMGGKLPEEAVVIQDGAKLRETPSTKAAVVGRLHKGVPVKIKAMKQVGKYQWFDVDYNHGRKVGWTREDNLQF